MIDIHNHILPNVDDGSMSMDTSISLLLEEKELGVKKVICTPHYRIRMFEEPVEKIKEVFLLLKEEADKIGIELFLGHEIRCNNSEQIIEFINNNKIISMNNTKYLLLEFSYDNNPDINEVIYNAKIKGYKVIIAHIERYRYLTINDIEALKHEGALIQVNAESVIGKNGGNIKKLVKNLIKRNLVDFIASDMHYNRVNYLLEAYNYVLKKFGKDITNKLFYDNAEEILFK